MLSSIRTQLILWNLAILATILIACGSAVHYRMQAGLIASVDRELVDRARPALNMPGPPPLPANSGASRSSTLGSPSVYRPDRSMVVLASTSDGDGQLLAQGGPPNGGPGFGPGPGGMGGGRMGFPGGPPGGPGGRPFGGAPPPRQGQDGQYGGGQLPQQGQDGRYGGQPPQQQGPQGGFGAPSQGPDGQYGDNGGPPRQGQFDENAPPPSPLQRPRPRPDVRVLDVTGRTHLGLGPFDSAGFQTALTGTPAYNTVSQPGGQYRVYSAPKLNSGTVQSVVQAEESLAPVQAEMADLDKALLTMIPLGLVAAALGAAFITIRSLRPVHQIADTVGRIQAEDLSRRLPVQGRDEFAQLSTTINGMLGRLQSAFDEQRRFTMDASHELKTPLTVIKAKTSVALTRERTPEAYQSTLQTVERAADQMTSIVQDLLLLAQADSGQLGADRNPVSVRYLVESALEGVFPESGGPAISVDIPEPAPTVMVNSGQMARVFRNLIENAVRHTPSTGRVAVSVQKSTAGIETVVRDTGEGIAPEHLARLGTRFYRIDTARTRERGGTGLGLAICKGIVEAHGGRMRFESVLGRGTTVHVWLPK